MTEPVTLRFHPTPDLVSRAMTAWQEPWDQMKARRFPLRFMVPMMVAGLIVGVAASSGLLDILGTAAVNGALFGFGLGMVFWFAMHRRQVAKLSAFTATRLAREGDTEARFDATSRYFTNATGQSHIHWAAIDAVIDTQGATALRIGAMIHPVPDDALPPGLTPGAFRARLSAWRGAA